MRQISVVRYKAKVRGVKRHLKMLDRWVASFEGCHQHHDGQPYHNYKIPVLDRLVEPPTTTFKLQRYALRSLLKIAGYLKESPTRREVPYYRVAVLITFPGMFASEVTVFYDPAYYARFWNRTELIDGRQSLVRRFDLILPTGFEEEGAWVTHDEDEDYPAFKEEWWTLGEPI